MHKQQNYKTIGEPMRGGMGQVQHLYHNHWKKDVAMKQPLEKYFKTETGRKRFYEECARWLKLGIHPHIVQCYYVCDIEEIPTVFMEWMEKGSLGADIKNGKIYEGAPEQVVETILKAAIQMAQGLAYSHQKGILHLDVKPDNVLIDADGCYKISDFGLASLLNQTSGKAYTPCYCAPEQQTGAGIHKGTDIYCWAVSILHLLVREATWFDGIVAGAAFDEIVKRAVVPVPAGLKKLLIQCLQYEIEKRPQDFEEVLEELFSVYYQFTGKRYEDHYKDYDGTSLDALNNAGISYYAIGDLDNASKQWQWNYWHNPGHVDSYYNYELFVHRFVGTCELNYLHSEKSKGLFYTRIKMPAFSTMLKSEWQYSMGAYASAYAYACQAKAASEKLFGPSNDIFAANFQFMKNAYVKIGPRVLKSMDMKKVLKVEGNIEEDCILLAYIYDERIVYVAKNGVFYLIDLSIPKLIRHQSGMAQISCAAVSRDGRYLALGNTTGGFYKTYEVKVMDLKENCFVLHETGKELLNDLQYLTFVEQDQEYPRLIACDEWRLVSWKLCNPQGKNQEIFDDSMKYTHIVNKLDVPVSCLIETEMGSLIAKSDRKITEYDPYFVMETSKKISTNFYELQKHKVVGVPNTNFLIFLDKSGGYIVYDYINQYIVTQESFLLNGDEKIHQLSVNPKGDKMTVLCGNRLEIRNMPDYKKLPEPLWKESRFQTTAEMLKKYNQMLSVRTTLERALDSVIRKEGRWDLISEKAMAVKLRMIRDYYYQSHKPMDEYLTLAVQMAQAFGFGKVNRMISRWTNESPSCMKMDADGDFIDGNGKKKLGIRPDEDGMNLNLVSAESGEILYHKICYRNELIGLSEDYCKVICKNNTGNTYQYRVIPLEWTFD